MSDQVSLCLLEFLMAITKKESFMVSILDSRAEEQQIL